MGSARERFGGGGMGSDRERFGGGATVSQPDGDRPGAHARQELPDSQGGGAGGEDERKRRQERRPRAGLEPCNHLRGDDPDRKEMGQLLFKIANNRRWSARLHAQKMGKKERGTWKVDTQAPMGLQRQLGLERDWVF